MFMKNIGLSYIKVHMATRWTVGHGLILLWFRDLINVTEKLQFIELTFKSLLSSKAVL